MANLQYTDTRAAAPEVAGPGFGLRAIVQELRRVVWPTRQELFRMTIVVIATVVVVATFIALIDTLLQEVFRVVYGTS